ncbi:transporter family-2 protein [Bacillus tianshenii]|uniref:Transporter family-2 protein n=1 Tax=Sutcliffiella tianshenii TaxID=1463404 RepID=A0ABS2P3K1_9BACI|nr:DMT family transporter [Bacillus tianshenii]MBM7621528.1 transporter family-2 protein [Bacillus tianshenii]
MVKIWFVLIAFLGGILGGIQAPVNSQLGKKIGSLEASFVSFFIGTLFLLLLTTFFGKGNLMQLPHVPKWQLVGGFLGACFVTFVIMAVPKIGVALTIISLIIGQMIVSMVIDHFGLFGSAKIALNYQRLLGVVMMLVALVFIYRGTVVVK